VGEPTSPDADAEVNSNKDDTAGEPTSPDADAEGNSNKDDAAGEPTSPDADAEGDSNKDDTAGDPTSPDAAGNPTGTDAEVNSKVGAAPLIAAFLALCLGFCVCSMMARG